MRKTRICKLLNETGEVKVDELSNMFGVSLETIRRDLKLLDKKGLLVRVYGGAISKDTNDIGTSFVKRAKSNVGDKQQLVEMAISQINEHSVIGLDASSSSWLLAQSLPNIECTVVTNSINIINALEKKTNIDIISLGGNYSEKYKSFYGSIARETLDKMSLDVCFISCVGVDFNSGVWDSNEYNHEIKKSLIKISNKVVLIADKSKVNKRSLLKVCDINALDHLITNLNFAEDDVMTLKENNVVVN
ncbi:L-fucose operon activator [Vibrio sp. MACH09]|uniref:DeoR/GlpR family DNA-binding transcription regulator n=1 Tax=unclassified Vibrio TaxID=2614977 RepID=UPI0014935DAC|nr:MULTISPECIES: DeoR/GlpR family DNA-binding transcription regulator [unclassified Vibrio]NOI65242.1 DeoR/GlpR transcriptional regulator [Vibrio sp. 99-8-1]GLO63352.1 L-fucose operon activator [Vibrio sp. MACH09]